MKSIRTKIGAQVARAIDSCQGVDEQTRHNWVEITTDRIINEFLKELPEPIDLDAKYELGDARGVQVTISNEDHPDHNGEQLMHLARFADDQGYNRYRADLVRSVKRLYKVDSNSVE